MSRRVFPPNCSNGYSYNGPSGMNPIPNGYSSLTVSNCMDYSENLLLENYGLYPVDISSPGIKEEKTVNYTTCNHNR